MTVSRDSERGLGGEQSIDGEHELGGDDQRQGAQVVIMGDLGKGKKENDKIGIREAVNN